LTPAQTPGIAPTDEEPREQQPRWRIPSGQRFVFEDFDDGIVMFDARVGATHLLSASAAETLALVQEFPGMTADAIYQKLLERLNLDEGTLPLPSVLELLWHLENLGLVTAYRQ
jgi:PqqD family protein of HPr-rel-A system